MRSHIDYSFCIVNWNGGEQFLRCLQSIQREIIANPAVACEIIVVDNNSDDLDISNLSSFKHLSLYQNASNELFAKATNQSIHHSSGKHLIILNNDIELTAGFLLETIQQLKQNPTIDLFVPQLLNPDGTVQKNVVGLPKPKDLIYYAFCFPLFSKKYAHWMNPDFSFSKTDVIRKDLQPAFSAMILTRKCWDTVGPLDEQFPLLWNDVEWFFRFHEAKQQALYAPSIRATHFHGFSVNKHRFKKIKTSTISMRTCMQKHYPMHGITALVYDYIYFQMMILRMVREVLLVLLGKNA